MTVSRHIPALAVPTLLLAVACLLPQQHARAAASYDNCTGFIDSVPATITAPGTWCLRRDLSTAMGSGAAITIAANNVTIDCNDFKIGGMAAGDDSAARGIFASDRQNATIRQCSVRGFLYGIQLTGDGHLVEDNRLDNNLLTGISVQGENGRVRRNAVYDTGCAPGAGTATGIIGSGFATSIVDNDVSGVFATAANSGPVGISAYGHVASGNRISGLTPTGTGQAVGIRGFANVTSVVGNQINPRLYLTDGVGISSVRFCANNTVANFETAYSCGTSVGNLP